MRVRGKGTHSVDEIMKLVEVHEREEHRTLKLSPETIEKTRQFFGETVRLETFNSAFGPTIALTAK